MPRALTVTRSSGVNEVLRALYGARAIGTGYVSPQRLLRQLPDDTPVSDLQTILDAQVTAGNVQTNGSGNYSLTTTGIAYSRSHKPRSRISVG